MVLELCSSKLDSYWQTARCVLYPGKVVSAEEAHRDGPMAGASPSSGGSMGPLDPALGAGHLQEWLGVGLCISRMEIGGKMPKFNVATQAQVEKANTSNVLLFIFLYKSIRAQITLVAAILACHEACKSGMQAQTNCCFKTEEGQRLHLYCPLQSTLCPLFM